MISSARIGGRQNMRGVFLSLALRFRRFSLAWSCHGSFGLLRSGVRLGFLCPFFVSLCLVAFPRVACAETAGGFVSDFVTDWYPHVVWSEDYSVEGNIDDYRHVLINADNINDAALLAISVGPNGVHNDVREFLSDSTYSPHFANVVSSLSFLGEWEHLPTWVPSYVRSMWLDPGNCYYGTLDTYEVKQAYKEYLAAVQYAEDGTYPEVSTGTGTIASTFTLYGNSDFYTNKPPTYYTYLKDNWNGERNYQSFVWTVNISDAVADAVNSRLADYPYVYLFQRWSVTSWKSTSTMNLWLVMSPTPFVNDTMSVTNNGARYLYFVATANQNTYTTFNFTNTAVNYMNAGENWNTWHWFKEIELGNTYAPAPSGTWSEPEPAPKWGVDVDWYDDASEAPEGDGNVTIGGDTVYNTETNTYTTNYVLDVEPILQRLDLLNMIVAQIGIDLRTVDDDIVGGFAALRLRLDSVLAWMRSDNQLLSRILVKMDELDKSTNDLVDLSSVSSAISGLSNDIDALISSVTGSHGSDALGLYGRLDTVLNWLDDYVPVDVSGIEQALEDWPDYPTFDDSGLLNAITGSHGSDLLGLFGRLDNVLSWLDDYVSPDLSTLNHQLGDLLDADGQTPTVHGLIYSVNGYVEDIDGLLADVLALGTVTVNGTTYGFTDLLYNTWLDLSRLVGMSTVTAGENTYSFADLLYNVWVDFGRLRDWLVEWWADLFARLDDIIDAIEDLPHNGSNPWHTSPVVDPSDPQGGPIIGPIETDPYGYPKMPDWQTYKEPLNIPALEHAVDELMTKFPFSMLNTIIQVAMFIERPAVAPQFDIPAPNPSDWSQPYLVHVDLSDYDTVAATLRLGIVIWAIVKISNRTINMWVGDKGGD